MKQSVKRLLSAALALCLVLSLPVFAATADAAAAGTESDPWDISASSSDGEINSVQAWYEGGKLRITGTGRMTESFRDTAPPWASVKNTITEVEIGEGVTNVGAYAFNFCKELTRVTLPEGLTEIGTYAFNFTKVKRLTIPSSVNTLGRMIANSTTYFEVLGNPQNVDLHAFTTSLVSVKDQATAEALNSKTNVSAIIVLNGGVYGKTDSDLANLSYGLIAPVQEGKTFAGWYLSADFSGQPCPVGSKDRTTTNINTIYYAKWSDTAQEPVDPVDPVDPVNPVDPVAPIVPAAPVVPPYSGGAPSGSESVTEERNEDGSITITVTDTVTGTVTITTIDPEGGKAEKVITAENGVTITVTAPNGETLVKVELPAVIPAPAGKFADVPAGHWAEAAIHQIAGLGLVNGVSSDRFDLSSSMKRGDLAMILFRLSNGNPNRAMTFDDVPANKYYANAVAWAAWSGVVTGYDAYTFGPEDTITREQLAVILYRYAKLLKLDAGTSPSSVLKDFADHDEIHDWAEEGLAWCLEKGIIQGKSSDILDPTGIATRAEVVVMLQRFLALMR